MPQQCCLTNSSIQQYTYASFIRWQGPAYLGWTVGVGQTVLTCRLASCPGSLLILAGFTPKVDSCQLPADIGHILSRNLGGSLLCSTCPISGKLTKICSRGHGRSTRVAVGTHQPFFKPLFVSHLLISIGQSQSCSQTQGQEVGKQRPLISEDCRSPW